MAIASGAVLPVGVEFLVNTTTLNDQLAPSVSALPGGRFLVVWEDNSPFGPDPGSTEIRAQFFDADGSKSGAEFVVNATEDNNQVSPTSTVLTDGRFVIAWGDNSQSTADTSGSAVRAQLFNADGSPSGAELLVNTTTVDNQFAVAATALSDGRFVLTWSDDSGLAGDAFLSAVRAQIFNADGSSSGGELLVNTSTIGDQISPDITALPDGRFVVTWYDSSRTGGDASEWAIRMQIFNSDGGKSGAEVLVNTVTEGSQTLPVITALSDGRFVVVWKDSSESATIGLILKAQVFNPDGSKSGAEFPVTSIQHDADQLAIAALTGGRFVVSWSDNRPVGSDSALDSVKAQVFNADGSASGAEFLVNSTTLGSQGRPSIVTLTDGRFVISWQDHSQSGSDTSGAAIRAQMFDPGDGSLHLMGTPDDDVLQGGSAGDILDGLDGNDSLLGEAGNDTLHGGNGNDTLNGGDGDDFIFGGADAADLRDEIYGGAGHDNIDAGYGNDQVYGQAGNDTIAGGFGSDDLRGQSGDDVITGSALSDLVFGGPGNDFVNGGWGHDRINGGSGADKFYHLGIFDHGSDWIQDYTAAEGDVLLFGDASASRDDFQVNISSTDGAGDAGVAEAFVIYRPTGQIMWALVDGAGQDEINLKIGGEVFDLLT